MFEPKIPAIGASIGFGLSLLVGIFSGASFPVMLVRAVTMGLLFGILFLFARIIILRFIPELFQTAAESGSGTGNAPDTGNFVDITIDESGKDDTLFERNMESGNDGMMPDFLETSPVPVAVRGSADPERNMDAETSGNTAFRPTDWQKTAAVDTHDTTAPGTALAGMTAGGLDVLPDLQDFIPQASDTMDDGDETADVSSSVQTGMINSLFSAPDAAGSSSVESETMVKAIRTILAKDN